MSNDELTHLDEHGRARMVDVSEKPETARRARAEGFVHMTPATRARILEGDLPKGDVLAVARLAGIGGAKRTADLIPLCHPLRIQQVTVEAEPHGDAAIRLTAEVRAIDRTGVEMEALTAVSVAALTLYDMIKGVDREAYVAQVRLLEKEGGRSGHWQRVQGEQA
jgi:cyclic pyranopterin phosphate synthase